MGKKKFLIQGFTSNSTSDIVLRSPAPFKPDPEPEIKRLRAEVDQLKREVEELKKRVPPPVIGDK